MSSQTTRISPQRWDARLTLRRSHLAALLKRRIESLTLDWVATVLYAATFVGIVVLGGWLRLGSLRAESVFDEEGITVREQAGFAFTNLYPGHLSHRTFAYMTTHYAIKWMGLSEFSLRFMPALLGTIGIGVTLLVTRRMSGSRAVGIISAGLVSLSVLHLHQSQFARFYAGLMLFSLLAMISIYLAIETGQKRYWAAFVLMTTLNLYNHLFAGFVLFSSVTWAGIMLLVALLFPATERPRRAVVRQMGLLIASGVAITLLYLPAIIDMLSNSEMLNRLYIGQWLGNSASTQTAQPAASSATALRADEVTGFHLLVELNRTMHDFGPKTEPKPWIFLALAITGLVSLVISRRWRLLLFLILTAATPFVLLTIINSGHFFNPYYVIFLLPLYFMAIGLGVERCGSLLGRAVRALANSRRSSAPAMSAMFTLVLFVPLIMSTIPDAQTYFNNRYLLDPRGAAMFIRSHLQAKDSVAMVDGTHYAGFSFYDALLQGKTYDGSNRPIKLTSVADAERQLDRHQRLWIVADRRALLLTNPDLYQWVIKDSLVFQFNGFPVYLKTRKGDLMSLDDRIAMMRDAATASGGTHNIDIPIGLGDLYVAKGDWHSAFVAYQQAQEAQPSSPFPLRKMGDLYAERGDWVTAASIYETMTRRWSDRADFFTLLGDAYQQLGQPDRALDAYRSAGRAAGSQSVGLVAAGAYFSRANDTENAIAAFQQAIQQDPENRSAWIGLASAEWQQNDQTAGFQAYQQALSIDDGDPSSTLALARFALQAGRYDEATGLAQLSINLSWNAILGSQSGYRHKQREKAPSLVISGEMELGDIAAAQSKWDQAQADYQEAASLAPYDLAPVLHMGALATRQARPQDALTYYVQAADMAPADTEAHTRLATTYRRLNQPDHAIAEYRTLASLNPNEPSYQLTLAELLKDAGQIGDAEPIYQDLINKAEKSWAQPALARVGGSPSVLSDLSAYARAYAGMGDIVRDQAIQSATSLESARRLYLRGLAFNPDEPSLYAGLSELYVADRRVDDAVSAFEEYAAKAPPSAEIQTELGVLYRRAGRMTDSEAAFRRAIQMSPSFYDAYIQLGSLFSATGKETDARDLYQQAVSVLPNNGGAYKRLGDLALQENEVSDALSFYLEAIARNPEHAPSYVAVGDLYRASGDVASARVWYERALQIKPNEQYIQRRLTDIGES